MPLRILAIEDDPLHAESLRLAIDELDHLLIDVVEDPTEFARLVPATLPDLLLMDIELGAEIDGVALAAKVIETHDAPVIFITSRQDMETVDRATEIVPAAYLTKPINAAALHAAITLAGSTAKRTDKLEDFFIKTEEGLKRVNLEDLAYIEASNKSCILVTKERREEISVKLKKVIDQLDADRFLQIHRSFVINLKKIELIDPSYAFVVVNGERVPIGRNFKQGLTQNILRL